MKNRNNRQVILSEKTKTSLQSIHEFGGRDIELLAPEGMGLKVFSDNKRQVALLIGETERKIRQIFEGENIYYASLEWVINHYC